MSEFNKFDEYKFFADNTHKLSERRQATTQTYLTVNTAIFGVIAFLVKDAKLANWDLVLATLPLLLVGLAACFVWQRIIVQYKKFINWRYDQLMAMESELCKQGAYGFYTKEYDDYYKPREGKEKFGFSMLEKILPNLISVLYVCGVLGVIAMAIF